MNKTGFQIRNNYFRAALYMKLIVDNVKYRGIQCDFGRLTKVFFVTPDSLLIAVQRDTDFFQYTNYVRDFNPAQKGVLNKAGFALHKSSSRNPRLTDAVGQAASPSDRVVRAGSIQHSASLKENSTVNNYKKPSATETRFPAEGCISGSQAIRACLMIRVFNN